MPKIREVVSQENFISNACIYTGKRTCCMKCTSKASAQTCAVQTVLHQVQNFIEKNFADFLDEVRVKTIQISPSSWWLYITVTIAIAMYLQVSIGCNSNYNASVLP